MYNIAGISNLSASSWGIKRIRVVVWVTPLFRYNPGRFSSRLRHLFSGKHTWSSWPSSILVFLPRDNIQFSWMTRKHWERTKKITEKHSRKDIVAVGCRLVRAHPFPLIYISSSQLQKKMIYCSHHASFPWSPATFKQLFSYFSMHFLFYRLFKKSYGVPRLSGKNEQAWILIFVQAKHYRVTRKSLIKLKSSPIRH